MPKMIEGVGLLYKLEELEKILDVSNSTLMRYCRDGVLNARKVGTNIYVTDTALKDFLSGKSGYSETKERMPRKKKVATKEKKAAVEPIPPTTPPATKAEAKASKTEKAPSPKKKVHDKRSGYTRDQIVAILKKNKTIKDAAKELGINRTQVYKWIKKDNIEKKEYSNELFTERVSLVKC